MNTAKADEFATKMWPLINAMRHMHYYEIADILNKYNIQTPSGNGKWHSGSVRRIILRCETRSKLVA
jgi:hypothetical protein